tara:strand:+ start:210 stop:578 length:369 start_codon:yes stop_codon:yes gene_type:complete
MGCQSCKEKNKSLDSLVKGNGSEDPITKNIVFIIFNILIRILLFAITLIFTPIIMAFVVWMLFKTIMLNKGEVNVMPSLVMVGKSLGIGKSKIKSNMDGEDIDTSKPEDYEFDEIVDKIKLK